MSLTVEFAGKTDIGCVRANNEDNFGYDARHGIFVVCDGMGGQAAGEVASKMGVDTILTYFRQADKSKTYPQIGSAVEGVSARANRLGSAIRLANDGLWNPSTGDNVLDEVRVDPTAPGPVDPTATQLVHLP